MALRASGEGRGRRRSRETGGPRRAARGVLQIAPVAMGKLRREGALVRRGVVGGAVVAAGAGGEGGGVGMGAGGGVRVAV